MGDLRNNAQKAEAEAVRRAEELRQNGFTVFHFDYDPKLTRRNMTLGQAIRHLMRVTGTRISWWRCPVRGLAITYRKLPTTSFAYDKGETYMVTHFSDLADEVEAKKVLALDMLLTGVELYRGLPNRIFDEQVELIRWLLKAPPSVPADEWLAVQQKVHRKSQHLLRTHESTLRHHLLGEKYTGPTGPIALTVRTRLEALGSRTWNTPHV